MAHEIDMTTGVPAIAYVGDKPWHGLGQELQQGADIDTWTVAAGLNWQVCRAPVEYPIGDDGDVRQMPGRNVLFRSDTFDPLCVVSDKYLDVQPAEIMNFFRKITEENLAQMETAGSLCGGKIIWALARMSENVSIMDDQIAPYLMLSTSYDMTTPTIAKMVATRVVCRNTIAMALDEAGRQQVRIPHKVKFNDADVRAGLGISLNAFEAFKQKALTLASLPFNQSDMDRYLIKLLQPESGEIDGDQIRKSKPYKNIIDLFSGAQLGADQEATKGTQWGAVNAVTQYVDHAVGRNQSTRLKSAWFGLGSELKQKAFALLAA